MQLATGGRHCQNRDEAAGFSQQDLHQLKTTHVYLTTLLREYERSAAALA